MDLLNIKVKHAVFGVGTVTEADDKYVTVQFTEKNSKFIYPDAFEKFIKAEDSAIQESMINDIAVARRLEEEKRQAELADRKAEEEIRFDERQNASPSRKAKNIEDGFGRGINITPSTVVLISSVDKKKSGFVYHDRWTADGGYIYSGEGKIGDQKMTSRNRAIVDAAADGKVIHLFVKFSPQEYYYQGVFELIKYTYEDDKDETEKIRKEYKFRLRKTNEV